MTYTNLYKSSSFVLFKQTLKFNCKRNLFSVKCEAPKVCLSGTPFFVSLPNMLSATIYFTHSFMKSYHRNVLKNNEMTL